jgi:F0F1-type ATP synthase membrane subunit b/b'
MQGQIDKRANAEGQRLAGDVARAEARIQATRVQALSQVHAIAAEAAATIVEHLGGSASAPQIQEAVAAHLKRSAAA